MVPSQKISQPPFTHHARRRLHYNFPTLSYPSPTQINTRDNHHKKPFTTFHFYFNHFAHHSYKQSYPTTISLMRGLIEYGFLPITTGPSHLYKAISTMDCRLIRKAFELNKLHPSASAYTQGSTPQLKDRLQRLSAQL